MMARPKQKSTLGRTLNKKTDLLSPKFEFPEDDSWVIVKKQIVRILVPPLSHNKQLKIPNSEPSQSQAISTEPASSVFRLPNEETNFSKDTQLQPPSAPEPCLKIDTSDLPEKPMLLAPKLNIPTARRSPRPIVVTQKLPKKDKQAQIDSRKHHHILTLHSRVKARKHTFKLLGGSVFLSQRMRASILEKKLRKAGGLSRWLTSMGLARFITIFQRKNVGKFQLANMSMNKLKDMGASAVGPRRKLIHAIDCLCEPSCFGAP